ncbi:MAG: hypothetical protein Kow0092_37500 [Deferrisomatales bacterium]
MAHTKRNLLLAAVAAALVAAGIARAELPAPSYMPNFPMLAGNQIMIMWMPVPGAVKYHVYMNGERIAESPAMQHFMPAPAEPGAYAFQVAAVDAAGNEGPRSPEGIVNIIKLVPPKGVVTLPQGPDSVALRWEAVKGAVIYDVKRAQKAGGPYELVGSVQSPYYKDAGLKPETTYYYVILSKDVTGAYSAPSQEVSATTQKEEKVVTAESVKKKASVELWRVTELDHRPLKANGSIALNEELGYLYVLTSDDGVFILDAESGDLVGRFGTAYEKRKPGEDEAPRPGELREPTTIAVDREGRVFVMMALWSYVQVFDAAGEFLKQFRVSDQPRRGWFHMTQLQNGDYAVVNLEARGVEIYPPEAYEADFRKDLVKVTVRDLHYEDPARNLKVSKPTVIGKITQAGTGELVVGDDGTQFVIVLDPASGQVKNVFGGKGGHLGEFAKLSAITSDARGTIYAVDWNSTEVQAFDAAGEIQFVIKNEEGGQWEVGNPSDVRITRDGTRMYITQPLIGRLTCMELQEGYL